MKYIDLTYLKDITSNNNVLIRRMIDSYIESAPIAIERLKMAYSEKKWEDLSAIAHEMQSSAGIVGNDTLRLQLKNLEDILRANDQEALLPDMIDKICTTHLLSLAEIQRSAASMT